MIDPNQDLRNYEDVVELVSAWGRSIQNGRHCLFAGAYKLPSVWDGLHISRLYHLARAVLDEHQQFDDAVVDLIQTGRAAVGYPGVPGELAATMTVSEAVEFYRSYAQRLVIVLDPNK